MRRMPHGNLITVQYSNYPCSSKAHQYFTDSWV